LREGFLPKEKAAAKELGGQPHEAPQILTLFSRARQARLHIVPIDMRMMCLALLIYYACIACALCVWSYIMVIGCMVVPFCIILVVDVLPLYD
jgi:fatty acid desaturase